MAKLLLYLKGDLFQQMDIIFPPFKDIVEDPQENFEFNAKLREEYISYQAKVFKVNFIRQIIKCQHDYQIVLVLRSKIGEENLINDSEL